MLDGPHPRYLVEAGCGPGFYSRRLAARFPQLHITGIDLSEPLLCRAQEQARRSGLNNCRFLKADALSLAESPGQVDAVIASRLFLILAQPALALDAIFTALRPGGICFIAEPASALRASSTVGPDEDHRTPRSLFSTDGRPTPIPRLHRSWISGPHRVPTLDQHPHLERPPVPLCSLQKIRMNTDSSSTQRLSS